VANFQDVELTDGRVVRVHRPPYTRIHDNVRKRFPEPEPPVVVEKTAAGKEIRMKILDDPAYLERHAEWEELYLQEVDKMRVLFMFKDIEVPEGWDVEAEVGEEMRFFDPDWKPNEGPMGRKLDYILWAIMGDTMDANRITNAEAELSGIDMAEVQATEASFRPQVEGQADQ